MTQEGLRSVYQPRGLTGSWVHRETCCQTRWSFTGEANRVKPRAVQKSQNYSFLSRAAAGPEDGLVDRVFSPPYPVPIA